MTVDELLVDTALDGNITWAGLGISYRGPIDYFWERWIEIPFNRVRSPLAVNTIDTLSEVLELDSR